ncbi:MAG: transglutaminase domain-containing protein [Acidimicrobiia bacterium]|nr:transglutaminase domain-containing protein [Acidimicrobiia bacterium]
MTNEHPRAERYQAGAAVALLAVHLVVTASFVRVLSGDWFLPLALMVVTSTAAVVVARRSGLGIAVTGLMVAALAALMSTWLFFMDTTAALLPTAATLEAASDSLRSAWLLFQDTAPPAPAEPGLLLATGVALAFGVFLADWAAFRLWAPIEALVPALTLFVFCSVLGSGDHQVVTTAFFAATTLAFWLLHRVTVTAGAAGWVTRESAPGSRRLLRVGAVLGSVAVIAGIVVGPQVPGADDEPVLDFGSASAGDGQRVTISPLVDIQRRLVEQSDIELFTVFSNERSYWRLTSLETFDDGIWRSSGRYRAINGPLPSSGSTRAPTTAVDQFVEVSALSALWLPAAFEPRRIDAPQDVRFHEDSSTLIVDTDVPTSDGFSYRVTSEVPMLTADLLVAADEPPPEDVAERYLELPADLTPVAGAVAQEVAGDAASPYEAALALQQWFRSEFTYSLEVPPGHDGDAIESFLDARAGYCEQFAGTYAVMARSLGIPARVSVGFTPGIVDPASPDLYRVRGEHAHAWPEVWLGRYGWVPFEPTPGRGAPGAEAYTGVPEEQVVSGGDGLDTEQPTTTTTLAPTPDQPGPPTSPPALDTDEVARGALPTDETDSGGPPAALVLVLLGALAYLLVVPGALKLRKDRRRRATDPPARIAAAWDDTLDALALVGAVPLRSETASEFLERAGRRLRSDGAALGLLAQAPDAARFAPPPLDDAVADDAETASAAVVSTVESRLTPLRRALQWFDPRPLLRSSPTKNARITRHRATAVR